LYKYIFPRQTFFWGEGSLESSCIQVKQYYCFTDIDKEIEEALFNFSICRLTECKLRSHVGGVYQQGIKQGLGVHLHYIVQIKPTNTLCVMCPQRSVY